MTEPSPDVPGFPFACPMPVEPGDAIQLAHGGGGLLTRKLIDGLFRPAFAARPEELTHDGAVVEIGGARLAFSTDSYVVRPLFFPGGDIGSLAVNGTVNDLAMCGATPLYLSAGLVLEEGFPIADLRRVVESMRRAAVKAGVRLITGDTKVVERGKGDGLYVATSGIGVVAPEVAVGPSRVRPGDKVLLSGDIGRHGIAIMSAREGLGFETAIESDCAPLGRSVAALLRLGADIHCLRDLTRGGLATALIEIAETAAVTIRLDEARVPISAPVRGAAEILGLDPLYIANEGRFVAFVPESAADGALAILRGEAAGAEATVIGTVESPSPAGALIAHTIGGERALGFLTGEQLPRIC